MVKWLMIPLFVLFTMTVQAKELTDEEKNKQKWFHIATVGDAITTIAGASCTAVKEINPILQGANPAGVIGFFVARNIAQQYVTKELIPDQWRNTWQNTWLGVQSAVVISNVALLIKRC